MRTVKDLINYLKTKDENLPLQIQYDGYIENLNIFEHENTLIFTNSDLNKDYEEAKIEFTTDKP